MLWIIYVIFACITGALVGLLSLLIFKNRLVSTTLIIVSMIASIGLTSYIVIPRYMAHSFAENIRKASPIVDLIAINSPADFNLYIEKVKENIIQNEDPTNIYLYTNSLISLALIKNIPNASNQSVYDYLTLCLEMDKKLIKIDPMFVLFIEYPNKFINKVNTDEVYKNVDAKTLNDLLLAKQNILASATMNKQPLSPSQRFTANFMFASIMGNLSAQHGRRMLINAFHNPDDPSVDKQKAAEVIIQYYEAILAKGPDSAGMIYKSLFNKYAK